MAVYAKAIRQQGLRMMSYIHSPQVPELGVHLGTQGALLRGKLCKLNFLTRLLYLKDSFFLFFFRRLLFGAIFFVLFLSFLQFCWICFICGFIAQYWQPYIEYLAEGSLLVQQDDAGLIKKQANRFFLH